MTMNLSVSFTWLLLLCICAQVCADGPKRGHYEDDKHSVCQTFNQINEALLAGHIERIEIFYLPPTVLTLTGLSPGAIDVAYKYKLEIAYPEEQQSFHQAVERTTIGKPMFGYYDFRWGCKLYNQKTKQVYTIYLDRGGRNAEVNHRLVSLSGRIYFWLKSQFPKRLESVFPSTSSACPATSLTATATRLPTAART